MVGKGSVVYGVFGGMMLDSYFKTLGEAKSYAKEKARRLRDAKLHTDMRVRVVKMEVLDEALVPKSNEPYGEIRLKGIDEMVLGRR